MTSPRAWIVLTAVLSAATATPAGACWMEISPGAYVSLCPLVITGRIERVDAAPAPAGPQSLKTYDTAHIRVTAVHKNQLSPEEATVGGLVAVRMSGINSLWSSTDLRYPTGTSGTWLIFLDDDAQLYINRHPVQLQKDASWWGQNRHARSLGRKPEAGPTRQQWLDTHRPDAPEKQERNPQAEARRAAAQKLIAQSVAPAGKVDPAGVKAILAAPREVRLILVQSQPEETGVSAELWAQILTHVLRQDTDDNIRTHAAIHLADPATVGFALPTLLQALGDPSADVRRFTCQELRNVRRESVIRAVRPLLADRERAVRLMAVNTLGMLQDAQSVPAIIDLHRREYNRGPDQYVFAESLSRLGEKEVSLAVVRDYADVKNWNTRYFVAEALGRIDSPAALELTLSLLPGELSRTVGEMNRGLGDRVFVALCQQLERQTGQALGDDVIAWQRGRDVDVAAAGRLLAEYRSLKTKQGG